MRPPPLLAAVPVVLLIGAGTPGVCRAQLEAELDAGASYVKYDGFLGSAAFSLTPSLTLRTPRSTLTARGSFLQFESGNTSVQALLGGATFSQPLGSWRVELAGEAGASSYADVATFARTLAQVRLHRLGVRQGVWVGPQVGVVSGGATGLVMRGVTAGAWSRIGRDAISLTVALTRVGAVSYRDLTGRARWQRDRWEVEWSVGLRSSSGLRDPGGYGDGSLTLKIWNRAGIVLAGGRYPSDPVRGSISGSFVTLGLHLVPVAGGAVARAMSERIAAAAPAPVAGGSAEATLERADSAWIITIRAVGAVVELAGDFTDWQPVPMSAGADGRFRYRVALAPGLYRFNIRIDGGPRIAPSGLAATADEFGGTSAVLVIP